MVGDYSTVSSNAWLSIIANAPADLPGQMPPDPGAFVGNKQFVDVNDVMAIRCVMLKHHCETARCAIHFSIPLIGFCPQMGNLGGHVR